MIIDPPREPRPRRNSIPSSNSTTAIFFKGTVVDVSNAGLGLRLQIPKRLQKKANELVELHGRLKVGDKETAFIDEPCTIRHSSVDMHPNVEHEAILGVALQENQSPAVDRLEFKRDQEEIDLIEGHDGIAELVRDLVLLGDNAHLQIKAGEDTFRGKYRHDTKLKTITSLKFELIDEQAKDVLTDKFEYTFFMEIYGSFYVFRSRIRAIKENILELIIPDAMVRVSRRLTQRVAPKEDETFTATFKDPFTGEKIVAKIQDFTERGFSAVIDHADIILPTGTHLQEISLRFTSDNCILLSGFVVRSTHDAIGSLTIGVKTAHNNTRSLMPLFDFVVSRRYPHVLDITPERIEQNWTLFKNAGYLSKFIDEKGADASKTMHDHSLDTWVRLDDGRGDIARNFGVGEGDQLHGSLHLTRFHRSTWVIHQLAILSGATTTRNSRTLWSDV